MKRFRIQISCRAITDNLTEWDKINAPIGRFYREEKAQNEADAKSKALLLFHKQYRIEQPNDFEITVWIEV